jgi:H+-transporting ATPase
MNGRAADPAAAPRAVDCAGLTAEEARRRLGQYGPNALPDEGTPALHLFLGKLWAPVPWMLEAAIVLQLAIGEHVEAAIIGALLLFNAALGFTQERRAKAALDALKEGLALIAWARRDGAWRRIPAADLVPGDLIRLSLGAIVPADARLLEGNLLLDQSSLTGESVPAEAGPEGVAHAGTVVRRGVALAEVTATGASTTFGRTVELVRIAHAESSEQHAVLAVVRNLAVMNGAVVVLLVAYAHAIALPFARVIPLVLTAVLASIPVALPATFTLAAALGAQALARRGVLLTRLSAIHEAAVMDVLCSDKTGTLTRNEMAVTAVQPSSGFTESQLLALAVLASSDGSQDPVDAAAHAAAAQRGAAQLGLRRTGFVPFDPSTKMSEAAVLDADGRSLRIVKGAFAAVSRLCAPEAGSAAEADALARAGARVLGLAVGPPEAMRLAGLVGLSDPPRTDSAALIEELRANGVQTLMVTGDAPGTAVTVARAVGLAGAVWSGGPFPERLAPADFAVYAGVLPEDKYRLVRALQHGGHVVGMCGDGVNDAPALRQAQIGIAVSSATDAAKAAAGIVLTEPGLQGIVTAIRESRSTFQRILAYTLNALIKKFELVLLLLIGLVMTAHAVMTPILMVLLLVTNDFLTMSLTTDRVTPSQHPDAWRIRPITAAAAVLGFCKLGFSACVLAVGWRVLHMGVRELQTLAFVAIAFSNQATVYVVRERRWLWRSRPSGWLLLSSLVDLTTATSFALAGILMAPLSPAIVLVLLAAAAAFALALDGVKVAVLGRFGLA